MRFLEYETWRLKKDIDMEAYDKIIKDWFAFVVKNRQELFPEWVSAKYYRKTDRDGNPNGCLNMSLWRDITLIRNAAKTGTGRMRHIRQWIRIRSSLN